MTELSLFNVPVSTGKYDYFIETILRKSISSEGSYVCLMNVHMLVQAYKDYNFKQVLQNADIVTPDGQPIVWALRVLNKVRQDRVSGMDLLPDLLQQFMLRGMSVFFYGGSERLLDETKSFLKQKYPSLRIAGFISPPFRALSKNEQSEIVRVINNSKPNVVFVILGCPKQENWMAKMKSEINATMIGIGGALPVMVGVQRRAPIWMQKYGLEWFFRLSQEPFRLFKRYAVTNAIFIYLLTKEILMKNLNGYLRQL